MRIPEIMRKIFVKYDVKRKWYRFSRSSLSKVGLVIALASVFLALAAPYVTPYPKHAGLVTNFKDKFEPPNQAICLGRTNLEETF